MHNVCFSDFKNLQSLEVCGGLITDNGVKNIKDLNSLTLLNLSQNGNLTDKTLELISGNSYSLWYHGCFQSYRLVTPSIPFLTSLSSSYRADSIGFSKCFQLANNQRRSPPPETVEESAIALLGVLQGDSNRDKEASVGCSSESGECATRIIGIWKLL